jgi:hypothetical protein
MDTIGSTKIDIAATGEGFHWFINSKGTACIGEVSSQRPGKKNHGRRRAYFRGEPEGMATGALSHWQYWTPFR